MLVRFYIKCIYRVITAVDGLKKKNLELLIK